MALTTYQASMLILADNVCSLSTTEGSADGRAFSSSVGATARLHGFKSVQDMAKAMLESDKPTTGPFKLIADRIAANKRKQLVETKIKPENIQAAADCIAMQCKHVLDRCKEVMEIVRDAMTNAQSRLIADGASNEQIRAELTRHWGRIWRHCWDAEPRDEWIGVPYVDYGNNGGDFPLMDAACQSLVDHMAKLDKLQGLLERLDTATEAEFKELGLMVLRRINRLSYNELIYKTEQNERRADWTVDALRENQAA